MLRMCRCSAVLMHSMGSMMLCLTRDACKLTLVLLAYVCVCVCAHCMLQDIARLRRRALARWHKQAQYLHRLHTAAIAAVNMGCTSLQRRCMIRLKLHAVRVCTQSYYSCVLLALNSSISSCITYITHCEFVYFVILCCASYLITAFTETNKRA
jgi:hypothetical protein